jgi:cytochrome c-type biogenesis protein CcmH/NrfF
MPPLITLLGGSWLWLSRRKSDESSSYTLSAAEEKKLRDILKKRD